MSEALQTARQIAPASDSENDGAALDTKSRAFLHGEIRQSSRALLNSAKLKVPSSDHWEERIADASTCLRLPTRTNIDFPQSIAYPFREASPSRSPRTSSGDPLRILGVPWPQRVI